MLDSRQTRTWFRLGSPESYLLALIAGTFVLRCLVGGSFGLGYGESYHFSCALRPNLSYFDHPPLSLLLGSLSIWLTGMTSALAVRFPTILLFAGTSWFLYLIGRRFFGAWPALYAVVLLNLSAVFTFSVGLFLQPDGPLMFFWLACVWCLTTIFFDEHLQRPLGWWAAVGVTLGLAMLSKYHAVFILFGAGMFALTSREHRRWVIHPGPYLAIAIAAAIFSPVLIWNHQHDWVSFLWQGNRGLDSHGFRPDWLLRNIGGQALWILPWIWGPLLWELPVSFNRGRSDSRYWFIAWMAVTPIVLFTVVSAYAPVGFHFHWQAPGYLLLFVPLGYTVFQRLEANGRWTRWWLRSSAVCTATCILMFTTHAATGWWRSVGPEWLANRVGESEDPTLECLDYKELAGYLQEKGLLAKPETFVFTNRWFQSGKVDFALSGQMPVMCLNDWDPRSWAFLESPDNYLGYDGVLVATDRFLGDPVSVYGDYFKEIAPLGTVDVHRGEHAELTLRVYLCKELQRPYPNPYQDRDTQLAGSQPSMR